MVFPGGQLSKYSPGSMLFNVGVTSRTFFQQGDGRRMLTSDTVLLLNSERWV